MAANGENPSAGVGLLDGLKVLDLSIWQPGHTATKLLADLGAEVLKVEPPGGDRIRPKAEQFVNFNGHKRSMEIDLKDDEDRARVLALVPTVEVVVEGSRPGVADRLGVGYDALHRLNPAIVVCSITGFGQHGPLERVAGHEHSYHAYAGAFGWESDGTPLPASIAVADQGSGTFAAFAIVSAVLRARATGVGEWIDVSIADLLASWVAPVGAVDPRYDDPAAAGKARLPGAGAFRTADGHWVEAGVAGEDHLWDAVCRLIGLEHLVGVEFAERTARAVELRHELAGAFALHDRSHLVDAAVRDGLPIAPILTREEMLAHPHYIERGTFMSGPDGFRRIAHPAHYRNHPARTPGTAPELDAHGRVGFGRPDTAGPQGSA